MILTQPQPVGIFPGATAHLLLPMPNGNGELTHANRLSLEHLLRGDAQCGEAPELWRFYILAARGDLNAAFAELVGVGQSVNDEYEDWSPSCLDQLAQILSYNQFVLSPSIERFDELKNSITDPQIQAMLQVVAFSYGLSNDLPEPTSLESEELSAWAIACAAAFHIEREDILAARQCLAEAVELARLQSPLLSAILLSQSAQLAQQTQLPGGLIQNELEQAIELAKETRLPGFIAELYTQLGMLLQRLANDNRSQMQSAIRAYQFALQSGVSSESNPIAFGELQNNLGLAYLSMPQTESSNQLRTGIAIQSFRRGLEAIDKKQHSELWARISMNLANALQYAPSSHPAENLIQAVELYEHVLEVRSRARDPVAYALVILNQANALAHLGIFKPALEKASEAYKLFQWYNQSEGAATARELVESVNQAIQSKDQTDAENPSLEVPEFQHGSV